MKRTHEANLRKVGGKEIEVGVARTPNLGLRAHARLMEASDCMAVPGKRENGGQEKEGSFGWLKRNARVVLAAVAITLGTAASGCGYSAIHNKQMVVKGSTEESTNDCNAKGAYSVVRLPWYRGGHIVENYLVCPTACAPKYSFRDDPIGGYINMLEKERWDYERAYYQECIENYRNGRPIPPRKTAPQMAPEQFNNLMDYQVEWIRERAAISTAEAEKAIQQTEKAQKELEKMVLLKGGCCKESRPEVIVTQEGNQITVDVGRYQAYGAGMGVEDIGKSAGVTIKNSGIDIKDQEKVCNGDYSTVTKAMLISKLSFEDCKYRPRDALDNGTDQYMRAIEQNISLLRSGEYTLLACGNATSTSGRRCETDPRDYGNGDISWKRARYALFAAVHRFRQMFEGTSMAAYMNRTELNERTTSVYLVKKEE